MIRKYLPIPETSQRHALLEASWQHVLLSTLLIVVFCLQSNAAEVLSTRYSSEAHQTSIVVQLDKPASYQTQYDPKSSMLSIYLLKTQLGAVGETINIDNGLIETVTLKEIMGDIVEVNVLLEEYICFSIFPLESPDRIAIDIAPMGLLESAKGAGLLSSAGDPVTENDNASDKGKIPHIPEKADSGIETESDRMISFALPFRASPLSFRSENYILFQISLSILLAIAIIVVGLKLRKVTKLSGKRSGPPEKSVNYADMVIRSQEFHKPGTDRGKVGTDDLGKVRKMKARKGRNDRSNSPQKQYEKVQELAERGMSHLEISRQTNVPIGEVSLILDLVRTMPQENSN